MFAPFCATGRGVALFAKHYWYEAGPRRRACSWRTYAQRYPYALLLDGRWRHVSVDFRHA